MEPEFDSVWSKAEFQQQMLASSNVLTYKLCLCGLLSPCTSETKSRACLVPDLGRSPPLSKDHRGFRGLVNALHIIIYYLYVRASTEEQEVCSCESRRMNRVQLSATRSSKQQLESEECAGRDGACSSVKLSECCVKWVCDRE